MYSSRFRRAAASPAGRRGRPARRALVVAAAVGLALLPTATAWADPVDDAVGALRNEKVFVADGSTLKVDVGKVENAIGSHELRVAVLPSGSADPGDLATRIGKSLGGNRTVAVIEGNEIGAASNVFCSGAAQKAIGAASVAHQGDLNSGDATSTLVDTVSRLGKAPQVSHGCGRGAPAGAHATRSAAKKSGGHSVWPWVVGLLVVVAVVAALLVGSDRRRKARLLEGKRAEVMSLYDRLGADVQNLDAGDDRVARQALADASERYTATGGLLAHADTIGEYEAARRTALEGLYAARTARSSLGLDPGPELPSPNRSTDHLTEAREVEVDGKRYTGYPEYTPGAPHYFGGGGGYAAGWYSFPFWETLLIGSALGGGFGGWGGGGGFESGYDRGYEAGRDDARDQFDNGGGGWDSGGGGDWGGGGGDWGGDSGGGDWDGGGGDWGGDSGGGDW